MTGSRTRPSLRLAAITVATTAGFALTSCGNGSEEPSGPDTATATPSSSPAESESAPGGEEVTAEINGAHLQAPAGWRVEDEDARSTLRAPDEDGTSPGSGILNADTTLAGSTNELADTSLDVVKESGFESPERLADAKFGGVTFFHIRAKRGTASSYDLYGAVVGESEVTVAWEFIIDFADRQEADALINQVMPSFNFEG